MLFLFLNNVCTNFKRSRKTTGTHDSYYSARPIVLFSELPNRIKLVVTTKSFVYARLLLMRFFWGLHPFRFVVETDTLLQKKCESLFNI